MNNYYYGVRASIVSSKDVRPPYPLHFLREYGTLPQRFSLHPHAVTIGFCGKVFRLLDCTVYDENYSSSRKFCYTPEEFNALVDTLSKSQRESYYHQKRSWRSRKLNSSAENIALFFTNPDNIKYDRFFDISPIFVGDSFKQTITYNAVLKKYEFFRQLDNYRAFQELQMWMSNQVKPFKPIPEVSDADMIIAKGFCPTTSFRKSKSSKSKD